jgi:hypothetical protein
MRSALPSVAILCAQVRECNCPQKVLINVYTLASICASTTCNAVCFNLKPVLQVHKLRCRLCSLLTVAVAAETQSKIPISFFKQNEPIHTRITLSKIMLLLLLLLLLLTPRIASAAQEQFPSFGAALLCRQKLPVNAATNRPAQCASRGSAGHATATEGSSDKQPLRMAGDHSHHSDSAGSRARCPHHGNRFGLCLER